MWRLVRDVGTLDCNSVYLYILLADRFAETCAVAEADDQLVALLTGFCPPREPATYFVWQVGVDATARGRGLALRLIDHVLAALPEVRFLEATVSPSNTASQALFTGFARRRHAPLEIHPGYGAELFPHVFTPAPHEPEPLLRIGPFAARSSS